MENLFLQIGFLQIGIVVVVATVFSFLAYLLRQPLIIAHILTGIVLGPLFLELKISTEFFQTFAQIGIAFLLFLVGLRLDWQKIREVGWVALSSGIGQVGFTTGVGFFLCRALGFDALTSVYLSLGFSFASTIVVVKLLSDKDELDRLYGRITVGFLIVQDLIAILALLFISSFSTDGELGASLADAFGKWAFVLLILFLLSRFVMPKIASFASRSQELLFLFGLAWCFAFAGALTILGFGVELGALLAGVTLAGTFSSQQISARIRPLRDFFLVIFFVLLGTQLTPGSLTPLLFPAMILSLFVMIGNPFMMILVMRALGYHPHTAFLTSTTTGQISEFCFILLASGIAFGHIGPWTLPLATMVALVTVARSAYLVTSNEAVYVRLRPGIDQGFHATSPEKIETNAGQKTAQIILFGYHRMGKMILPRLRAMRETYRVVDVNPFVIQELAAKKIPHLYGDASDQTFLEELHAERARLIISTIPDEEVSLQVLSYLKRRGFKGKAIMTVRSAEEAENCYRHGAAFVIVPSILGGERFAELLAKPYALHHYPNKK
jgi:Kef-type K+ transport system membrane component KefB